MGVGIELSQSSALDVKIDLNQVPYTGRYSYYRDADDRQESFVTTGLEMRVEVSRPRLLRPCFMFGFGVGGLGPSQTLGAGVELAIGRLRSLVLDFRYVHGDESLLTLDFGVRLG